MKLCANCDVLYVNIGCVCNVITSGIYVSHAAAPSRWLDFVLPYLKSCAQTVGRLATEMFARPTLVCSHGVKKQPGKGRNNLENVFPQHLWFSLSVYPTWCGIVCLVESGNLLAPSCAPGLVNQGGGAVRGVLPRYPKQ